MKTIYLELNGYKRFRLNEISHFAMTIHSALQLIIGTNGSGKSSLLEQLCPGPGNPRDFTKTGSKIHHLEHDGKLYKLLSRFSPKQEHRFELDGEELNQSGLVTVQNELVKKHFGYSPDVMDLALSREKFTRMSPSRRKEWFLKLNDNNFDYAIKVWNRARDKLRDVNGFLKLARRNLVAESEKLIGDDEMNRLKGQADQFHRILSELLEVRKPVENDLHTVHVQQEQLSRQLITLGRTLDELLNKGLSNIPYSVDEYDGFVATAHNEIVRTTALLERVTQEFKKNDDKVQLLRKSEAKTVEALSDEIERMRQRLTEIHSTSLVKDAYPLGLPKPREAFALFETLVTPLADLLGSIPGNEDRRFSSAAMTAARERIQALHKRRQVIHEHLERCRIGIKHLEGHRDNPTMECPKCTHRFSPQYDAQRHEVLRLEAQKLGEELEDSLVPELKLLEEYLLACSEYAAQYRHYVQLTSAELLKPYWALWEEQELVRKNPRSGVHHLQAIDTDLRLQMEADQLQTLLQEKTELKQALQLIGSADLNTLQTQQHELEQQIGSLTSQLQKATTHKSALQREQSQLKQYLEMRHRIRSVVQQKRQLNKDGLETIRRQTVIQLIRDLQSALAKIEERIGTAGQQAQIVKQHLANIEASERQEKAWTALVKELSPTEGLIAEGMLGYIRNFITQMNALIASVWTYSLEIQSCELVEGETVDLDYRFPFKIENEEEEIADVSLGSSGMLEIFDLAFQMTALQHLKLQDGPLFLDELGKTMDAAHKAEVATVVKTITEQGTFSQVFMISHDFFQYGALSNAEICLLNSRNVMAPSGEIVNQHVEMT